jgi:hypothetical protein
LAKTLEATVAETEFYDAKTFEALGEKWIKISNDWFFYRLTIGHERQ